MKAQLLVSACAFALAASAASPSLKFGSVTMTQDPNTRKVTISYELENAPAIVTLDIVTNGVSIGGENIQRLAGDVNHIVEAGQRTIYWSPVKDWKGHVISDNSMQAVVTVWPKYLPPDYMILDMKLETGGISNAAFYASKEFIPGGFTNDMYKLDKLMMRKIPAAGVTWIMGSPTNEIGRTPAKEIPHYVTFTYDYYFSIYTVTQQQYLDVKNSNPSAYDISTAENNLMRPVTGMTYNDLRGTAPDYDWPNTGTNILSTTVCGILRDRYLLTFDIPTDAQWEYACRAGTTSAFNNGTNTVVGAANLGWYITTPVVPPYVVGLKLPNAWDIYDMHGNAWEWVRDWYQETISDGTPVVDPEGPKAGENRMTRGGSTSSSTENARSAARGGGGAPNTSGGNRGFRVVCEALIP